jgi:cytochrome c-type biogenesis protein CcmH
MLFWVLVALLTAAAIMAVLLPLGRPPVAEDAAAHARRVYRDQLEELERDNAEGRIDRAEAEAARAEIARRLIAAGDEGSPGASAGNPRARRATAVATLIGIPLLSMALYVTLGAPNLPGAPLAGRLTQPNADQDINVLIAKVEERLALHPEDGRGWDVIAPVYLRLGRAGEAVRAYGNAIRLLGSTAVRQMGLGEAIVASESGIITQEASAAFDAAHALDPAALAPRFYLALAAEQEGNFAKAVELWRMLLTDAPAAGPWRMEIQEALARVEPKLAEADPDVAAAIAALPESEQAAAIEGMVASLAERLKSEPNDAEGWLRLIRSYAVLGRGNAAAEAARDALAGLDDPDDQERVHALIAELGVTPSEASTP